LAIAVAIFDSFTTIIWLSVQLLIAEIDILKAVDLHFMCKWKIIMPIDKYFGECMHWAIFDDFGGKDLT
jgi:ABC-type sulfate transport system permease subunit